MISKETILDGAPQTCLDCAQTPELQVCSSMAGYYLGTYCNCGPYSRETGYFHKLEDAEKALAQWKRGVPEGART